MIIRYFSCSDSCPKLIDILCVIVLKIYFIHDSMNVYRQNIYRRHCAIVHRYVCSTSYSKTKKKNRNDKWHDHSINSHRKFALLHFHQTQQVGTLFQHEFSEWILVFALFSHEVCSHLTHSLFIVAIKLKTARNSVFSFFFCSPCVSFDLIENCVFIEPFT